MLHVTVHPKRFVKRLKAIAALAPRHHPATVLETIQLAVAEDGTATLAATDLDTAGRISVPLAGIDEPGTVQLPRERTLKALGEAKGTMLRIQELAPEKLPITPNASAPTRRVSLLTSRSEVSFLTHRPEDYPAIAEQDAADAVEVLLWRFQELIESTRYATDPMSTRYALAGALLEFADEQLSMVATDGRRLAHAYAPASGTGLTPLPHFEGDPEQLLAPAVNGKALKALSALLRKLSATLRGRVKQHRDFYVRLLTDILSNLPPPKQPSHRGASRRVRWLHRRRNRRRREATLWEQDGEEPGDPGEVPTPPRRKPTPR